MQNGDVQRCLTGLRARDRNTKAQIMSNHIHATTDPVIGAAGIRVLDRIGKTLYVTLAKEDAGRFGLAWKAIHPGGRRRHSAPTFGIFPQPRSKCARRSSSDSSGEVGFRLQRYA